MKGISTDSWNSQCDLEGENGKGWDWLVYPQYLVQGPPENTEHVRKILHVVVVALEEQVFHISSFISKSPKLESL